MFSGCIKGTPSAVVYIYITVVSCKNKIEF